MCNAVKFTPSGGSITVKTLNGKDGSLVLEIVDSGIGFEDGVSDRLFKAFEQGDRNITRQFGGLGLGLAITQSIVQSHGGSVRGQSKGPGLGATFYAWNCRFTSSSGKAARSSPKERRIR